MGLIFKSSLALFTVHYLYYHTWWLSTLPCAMRKTYNLFCHRYNHCSPCVRGKTCSLFFIKYDCCSAPWIRGNTCSLFCKRCDYCYVQSLLHKVWLLFCTMCKRKDVQSLICQVMRASFIRTYFFVRCEMLVFNAREVGMLVCWRWLGTCQPGFLWVWALASSGTCWSEYLSSILFGGYIVHKLPKLK